MPLDRHAKRLLEMIGAGRREESVAPTADALRQSMVRLAQAADARHIPIGRLERRRAPGAEGTIPIAIYTPCDTDREILPGIVYFHGGMGISGDLRTPDGLCRILANASGSRVISVGYRLAPEHPFPAGVNDAMTVTSWIAEHAVDLAVDSNRLVVAGDSAGGTLAAVVCQIASETSTSIALQLLLCPVTDLAAETESRLSFAQGYFIERSTLEWAKQLYCAGAPLTDPRISPLRASSFAGLPPALIHTAEFDPMRDEGEAYARALERAGVPVRYTCHEGLIHHFYSMAGAIPRARSALMSVGYDLRAALDGSWP